MTAKTPRTLRMGSQAGFSLPELLISITIFLIVSGVVTQALLQMTNSQRTIWNRTQMHSGVRSATELLQQEVGQAGRVSLPYATTLAAAVVAGAQTVGVKQQVAALPAAAVAGVAGIFVGEQLTIDAGEDAAGNDLQETIIVTAVDTAGKTITATFALNHPTAPVPVMVLGGFANGIVPLAPAFPNGSTATLLKLFGDINGDGNMVYVEYKCDTAGGNLYRNVMAYDAGAKAAPTSSQILLNNIQANPDGTGCFTFEPNPLPGPYTINGVAYNFVLDVAITLTVKTQNKDPITNLFQLETKALLNVSPRNVFNVWQLAQAGITNRVQPNPPTVTNLLIG